MSCREWDHVVAGNAAATADVGVLSPGRSVARRVCRARQGHLQQLVLDAAPTRMPELTQPPTKTHHKPFRYDRFSNNHTFYYRTSIYETASPAWITISAL